MTDSIQFHHLPLAVRVSTALSMFMAWVLFAEMVIDRHGLDRHLPFYRVGNLCVYDLLVALLIVTTWIWAHRRGRHA
jgi:hypothetical protein